MALPKFPARYSREVVDAMLPRLEGVRGTIVDPFAGQGSSLPRFAAKGRKVVGIEIEYPNVEAGNANGAGGLLEHGDATRLRFRKASVAAVFTSCAYGNRFADSHKAQERCRNCRDGRVQDPTSEYVTDTIECPKCAGTGHRNHTRRSYTHDIRELTGNPDYELDPRNSGKMHFGPEYQELHREAWREAWRVLRPGGLFLLNVSDFIRDGGIVHVTTWHLVAVQAVGFVWEDAERINTRRMRRGANHRARVEGGEWLLCFRKPE